MPVTTNFKHFSKKALWRLAPEYSRRSWVRPAKRNFSIGIYVGNSPYAMRPATDITNPVLTAKQVTDIPARCVADPFMLQAGSRWYMFFEVENQITMKGEIALATSEDALHWQYQQVVLVEPWHLSYPYVFEWEGEFFMIPESARNRKVTLYKAANFPSRWTPVTTLLEGGRFADSSIFRYSEHWWMLVDAGPNSQAPALRLYSGASLHGPWQEHPASPVRENDPHISRPGGRMLIVDGRPIRLTQDVYPEYGKRLSAFEITQLTETSYQEQPVGKTPVLEPGDAAWNSNGMHHMDAHLMPDGSWLACVDGY